MALWSYGRVSWYPTLKHYQKQSRPFIVQNLTQTEIVGLKDTRRASDANAIDLNAPCMPEVIDIRCKPASMISKRCSVRRIKPNARRTAPTDNSTLHDCRLWQWSEWAPLVRPYSICRQSQNDQIASQARRSTCKSPSFPYICWAPPYIEDLGDFGQPGNRRI